MRFSTSAFAPACTSPNHCEADPLRLYPDASDGEAAVTRYRVFPGMELDYRDVHARACRELRDGSGNGWRSITVWRGGWNTGKTAAISICLREIWR